MHIEDVTYGMLVVGNENTTKRGKLGFVRGLSENCIGDTTLLVQFQHKGMDTLCNIHPSNVSAKCGIKSL